MTYVLDKSRLSVRLVCRPTVRNGKLPPAPTPGNTRLSGSDTRERKPHDFGAFTGKNSAVCIRHFDRQSPQTYSVSRSRLWAQRCGYGTGETGGNRSLGGRQLHRREYRGQPALCWSQGAALPIGRVQGGSAWAVWRGGKPFLRCPEVENLGPGKVDACVQLVLGIT